jgi:hypothetical protein
MSKSKLGKLRIPKGVMHVQEAFLSAVSSMVEHPNWGPSKIVEWRGMEFYFEEPDSTSEYNPFLCTGSFFTIAGGSLAQVRARIALSITSLGFNADGDVWMQTCDSGIYHSSTHYYLCEGSIEECTITPPTIVPSYEDGPPEEIEFDSFD